MHVHISHSPIYAHIWTYNVFFLKSPSLVKRIHLPQSSPWGASQPGKLRPTSETRSWHWTRITQTNTHEASIIFLKVICLPSNALFPVPVFPLLKWYIASNFSQVWVTIFCELQHILGFKKKLFSLIFGYFKHLNLLLLLIIINQRVHVPPLTYGSQKTTL